MSATGGKLLTRDGIEELTEILEQIGADAWLLFDFGDRNPLARRLLGLEKTTRPSFVVLRRSSGTGPTPGPVLLRHGIEGSQWRHWRWPVREYSDWREVPGLLRELLAGSRAVAMEVSEGGALPAVDRVPSGVVEMVRATGVRVISSADLITTFHSRWTPLGLERHRAAAEVVQEVARAAFERAADTAERDPISEGVLMDWIRSALREEGITEQVDCIVASGPRSADPHYQPEGHGAPLEPDTVVLIDLWGASPGGVPADQTWMGYLGVRPPDRAVELWRAVRDARDAALEFLVSRAAGTRTDGPTSVRGWEVDAAARSVLRGRGLDRYFVHRLGHSIDDDLHGSGPNLDDFETRDERRLLPGIGFSVEPGVYVPGEMGMRTEVNVYLGGGGPEVTPPEYQRELLTLRSR